MCDVQASYSGEAYLNSSISEVQRFKDKRQTGRSVGSVVGIVGLLAMLQSCKTSYIA